MVNSELTFEVARKHYRMLLNKAYQNESIWNEGLVWYEDAQNEAVELAKESIQPVIGGDMTRSVRLAAALLAGASPAKSWEQGVNQLVARQWAAQLAAGMAPKGHMSAHNAKAQIVWDMVKMGDPSVDELSAVLTKKESKVSRFFRNILGDMQPATIDGHMINAAKHGEQFVAITKTTQSAKEVKICEAALRDAAEAYGVEPAIAQAIIWVMYKAQK